MAIEKRPSKNNNGWQAYTPGSGGGMKNVIFCVGMHIDARIPPTMVGEYIRRAIDHYHEKEYGDKQDTFDGVNPPENIIIVEVDLPNEIGKDLDVEIDGEPQKLTIRESYKKKLAVFKVLERLRK